MIEINKQYIGQVIEILPEGDFYKIKLNDLDIVLTRKVYKEARKNVKIVINKEYIVTFSTVVEPLQYSVLEKLK